MTFRDKFQTALFLSILAISYVSFSTISPAHANSKYAAIVIQADSGDILFDRYSTQKRYPASLTKMMTLYLLFEEIEAGRLTLQTPLKASHYAASMPASKLGLKAGETITVEKAIEALVIKSANDVAVVVAERISGSEKKFAQKMTNKAWSMWMKSTRFRNASGLPNRKQYSTARDLAVLSQRVVQDFPQHWHYFQKSSFTWKGKTYRSHNKLIGKFSGADGLKTGYTRMSGYNLATSVTRGENRVIGIVLGGRSGRTRDAHMRKIIDQAYLDIKRKPRMLSAIHRVKPTPSLKPTTLAALGGVWPLANETYATAGNDADAASPSSQDDLMTVASLQTYSGADGVDVVITDDMSDADRLNAMALMEAYNDREIFPEDLGQGDIDRELARDEYAWSIQIGAFRDRDMANQKLKSAQSLIAHLIPTPSSEVSEVISNGKTLYRARFNYLTEDVSTKACSAILGEGGDCFVMRNPSMTIY